MFAQAITMSFLNPRAPEFFPFNYQFYPNQQITQQYYHAHFIKFSFYSSPNPDPSSRFYPPSHTQLPYDPYMNIAYTGAANILYSCNLPDFSPQTNGGEYYSIPSAQMTQPASPPLMVSPPEKLPQVAVNVAAGGTRSRSTTTGPSCVSRGKNACRHKIENDRGHFRNNSYSNSGRERNGGRKEWRSKCGGGTRSRNVEKVQSRWCSRRRVVFRSGCGNYGRPKPHNTTDVLPVEPDSRNTTVMVRNIPNRYTRDMLMDFLDNHCMVENQKAKALNIDQSPPNEAILSAYDFLYLPIDFHNGANKGYAFVNFTNSKAAWRFHISANDQSWVRFRSSKIRQISCARLQGKEMLVNHFESSVFECGSDGYLPVCFNPARDGSKVRVEEKLVGKRIGFTKSSLDKTGD